MHNQLKKISTTPQANTIPYSDENGHISSWLDNDPVILSLKQENEFIGTMYIIPSDEDLQSALTEFVQETEGREPRNGDQVNIEELGELWMYNGTQWVYFARTAYTIANTARGTDGMTLVGNPSDGIQAHNVGINSSSEAYGTSYGYSATASQSSVALGTRAESGQNAIAIGSAINTETVTEASGINSIAIGYNAKSTANSAIQLGTGTNNTSNTLQVGSYELLDSTGIIPLSRLDPDVYTKSNLIAGEHVAMVEDSDENMTINNIWPSTYVGATAYNDGQSGLVLAPTIIDRTKFLKGDGTWGTPITIPVLTWYKNNIGTTVTVADTSSANLVKVYKNGLLLEPTEDYTISGTTLTLIVPLVSSDKICVEVI